ncbi:AraC family transcriptional regulator [Coraliomargarita algicola]|uniref:AraC family transcriptional regulator n=1 Tax=Coraliomargarita algicola TaxID=3092156 RepID=A0ABZ0RSP8_9BACT|nr:AraC family transcriptional regulator [Coraliomargarita sp. J2-16]WPJ97990.1 AraC family transcriptional regulator [Coraliomargarita sp. J2-16]
MAGKLMQDTRPGLRLSGALSASAPACPFLPPSRWDWAGQGVCGHAEWFQLREGLGYIDVECRLDGPNPCHIDLGQEYLVMGFVTQGWAKWSTSAGLVEKVEAGQWFTMPRREFSLDRTATDGVVLGLCICSRVMASQLSELSPQGKVSEQLRRYTSSGARIDFAGGQMDAATFNLARLVASREGSGLRRRLRIEANTLTWISELLSHVESLDSAGESALNAADRDAIQLLCEHMRHDPGYEYSMAELCQLSGLNEHKLKSSFKRIHGKTTFGYLRELRMDFAASLLKEDRLSVIQVANEVGYTNASHFARAFKERHGLLPKAYQCLHRRSA